MANMGHVMVPVKIAGVNVGKAKIYSDGRIEFATTVAGPQGRQIYELIQIDFSRGLSIVPILIPATPAESQT
jgi:hypothetical protein